ncbi:MAG: hypothetical protein ACLQLC_07690 [Candidatus Sulfotelmatobacter sp.]
MVRIGVVVISAGLFFLTCLAQGQENNPTVFLGNQEARVSNLPAVTAVTKARPAVLAAALEIILHNKAVCCGKESALADAVAYAALSDPLSLKDLAGKVSGRQRTSEDQPVLVDAEYVAGNSITADFIVRSLLGQRALIMEWKSHLYVLYGALYNEVRDNSGGREFTVDKLYLQDPRFSDEQREVVFNRETDDLTRVQGVLAVSFTVPPSPWK